MEPLPASSQTIDDPASSCSQSRFADPNAHAMRRRRRRQFLIGVSVMVVAGMGVGLVFIAHHYYHMWGGQGFLKARHFEVDLQLSDAHTYLPLGLTAKHNMAVRDFQDLHLKRFPKNVAFRPCGDQQNSCEAYDQPYICCPVGMSCFPSRYTNSDVVCCNGTSGSTGCTESSSNRPKCAPATVACSEDLGGGCCSDGSTCSPNGCIEFDGSPAPPPITSVITTTISPHIASKTTGYFADDHSTYTEAFVLTSYEITTTYTFVMGGPTTPTATIMKQGEIAQEALAVPAPHLGWSHSKLQYSMILSILLVALTMVLL